MSDLFNKSEYSVSTLMSNIENGDIGLPDLQRPFVWPNTKVRDLFDSMYRGYPVGHLLLWKEKQKDSQKQIGQEPHQASPSLLILDGQQRLTSLYAVIKAKRVLRDNYASENIKIAFNPLKEVFKVADASTEKNRFFINNISDYFINPIGNFDFITNYIEDLKLHHTVTVDETKIIAASLSRLWALNSYMFTAIELVPGIDEEAAAEIFVRINSKGTVLKQADFILTLMSVHWEEGRKRLEDFCVNAKNSSHEVSPYNNFIEPSPEQMLRVVVGFGFRRARLKYVYQLLKGKNLETGEITVENSREQFTNLQKAQEKTLRVQNWQDFLLCISTAGFRNRSMISSENTLLYCYTLFLIGKYIYQVDAHNLQKILSKWFFMVSITKRYTSSPETKFEKDLSLLPKNESAEEFIKVLQDECAVEITSDFWKIKLPNELLTTNTGSPAFCAYQAALVILGAKTLFSSNMVTDLLDPSVRGNRMIEKHHLFPKAYLDTIGINDDNRKNQIANLALVWWSDNMLILDTSPEKYIPPLRRRYNDTENNAYSYWHALPNEWYTLNYDEFLAQRRRLISNIICDAYEKQFKSIEV